MLLKKGIYIYLFFKFECKTDETNGGPGEALRKECVRWSGAGC